MTKRSVIYVTEKETGGIWAPVWSLLPIRYLVGYKTRQGAQKEQRLDVRPELAGRYRVAEYVRREPEE